MANIPSLLSHVRMAVVFGAATDAMAAQDMLLCRIQAAVRGLLCHSVGLASIKAPAHGVQWDADLARNLRSVNLGWCERVTEAGVAALAAGCPKLQALDLCGCIRVRLGSSCAAHASTA